MNSPGCYGPIERQLASHRYIPLRTYLRDGSYSLNINRHAHAQSNDETMIKDLDTADELRKASTIRITSYHNRLANHNRCVKPSMFQPGDLVLRKVFENTADPSAEKFKQNWEGPYIVTQPDEFRSYALNKLDGTPVPRMWNVMHLKRYYQ